MHVRSATPPLFLALSVVVACGGRVVLDGSGATTGGGGGPVVGSTSSGALDCTCGGSMMGDGYCFCTGACTDGSTVEVACQTTGSGSSCGCARNGVAVGTCTPSATPPSARSVRPAVPRSSEHTTPAGLTSGPAGPGCRAPALTLGPGRPSLDKPAPRL